VKSLPNTRVFLSVYLVFGVGVFSTTSEEACMYCEKGEERREGEGKEGEGKGGGGGGKGRGRGKGGGEERGRRGKGGGEEREEGGKGRRG
jgi:hypothetical protein